MFKTCISGLQLLRLVSDMIVDRAVWPSMSHARGAGVLGKMAERGKGDSQSADAGPEGLAT